MNENEQNAQDQVSAAAAALGRRAKGHAKRLTAGERARRRAAMERLNAARADIRRFREHLNSLGGAMHKNGPYHQSTRSYGDYLYHQDREKFMVDLRKWLSGEKAHEGGKDDAK